MDAFLVSVITPAFEPVPEHLIAAYDSLRAQQLPAGWRWEWLLQEDGETGRPDELVPDDPRVRFASGRHCGVAVTRNLALARADGRLIRNLDQDDILTPGALARDIQALSGDPAIGWTTSRALDLLPDGTTAGVSSWEPAGGPLARGEVAEYWRSHGYRLPVHPTTLCIRRALVDALGGWMAVPGSDDTGLLVAASVVSTGHFEAQTGLLYRKWPGQVSASAEHHETAEWSLRMALIDRRAKALCNVQF